MKSEPQSQPRYGSRRWRLERAELRATVAARRAFLDALRCPHGQLPGRCLNCQPINPDRIPF